MRNEVQEACRPERAVALFRQCVEADAGTAQSLFRPTATALVSRFLLLALLVGHLPTISAQSESLSNSLSPRKVNEHRAALAGIRKLTGRHLTLYTDLAANPAVDELPAVFDAAVPQWADYFEIDANKLQDWRIQGYLIHDRTKFAELGLLSETNANFANGYAQAHELWLEEQPSDYYRRHLLLHEGTHSFMLAHLGGAGPSWYMEGIAELLATHHSRAATQHTAPNQKLSLRLRHMPADRDEVPMWGRIKLIRGVGGWEAQGARRKARDEKQTTPNIAQVMQIDNRRKLATAEYAWCWALVSMLDSHPQFQKPFRQLQRYVADPNFNDHFRRKFAPQWPELTAQWQSLVSTLDYGHDFSRMAIRHVQPTTVVNQQQSTSIDVDCGWQSTGWRLEAGKTYQLTARGRFQIAEERELGVRGHSRREAQGARRELKKNNSRLAPPNSQLIPWMSEPGGITLEYHAGRPLGILLGALLPPSRRLVVESTETAKPQASLLNPIAVGLGTKITPDRDAVLYLRVNDRPAWLGDNQGQVEVSIEPR